MGFHICHLCGPSRRDGHRFPNASSGDVTLRFAHGPSWQMPDMILHYVEDHGWRPPEEFVSDILGGTLAGGHRVQTRGLPTRVGYLNEAVHPQTVPAGFVDRLETLMREAARDGGRIQTKGLR